MAEEVRAQITGVVFQVVAQAGSRVAAGDPILILESMKMEIPVEAPRAGVVRTIPVAEGQTVQEGDVVAVIE
jgi:biotin carboxyl carrier protein